MTIWDMNNALVRLGMNVRDLTDNLRVSEKLLTVRKNESKQIGSELSSINRDSERILTQSNRFSCSLTLLNADD